MLSPINMILSAVCGLFISCHRDTAVAESAPCVCELAADEVAFDESSSPLHADDVQGALEELEVLPVAESPLGVRLTYLVTEIPPASYEPFMIDDVGFGADVGCDFNSFPIGGECVFVADPGSPPDARPTLLRMGTLTPNTTGCRWFWDVPIQGAFRISGFCLRLTGT